MKLHKASMAIIGLIQKTIEQHIDLDVWHASERIEESERDKLRQFLEGIG